LSGQAEDLRGSINSLEKVIVDLDDKIQIQFDTSFKSINKEFERFFKILFDGGKADLVLMKEENSKPDKKDKSEVEGEETEELGILDKLMDAEENVGPKAFLKRKTGKVITGIDITATPPGKKFLPSACFLVVSVHLLQLL